MAKQLSLLEHQRLTDPGATDAQNVAELAASVIRELDVEPPIDPALVASYLGVADVQTEQLDVAGCLVCDRQKVLIKVRRDDPPRRRRFTVCHECIHTFFPGYSRRAQYRCEPRLVRPADRSLEALCDMGASELLMPRAHFTVDTTGLPFGFDAVEHLADRYESSLEATGHRVVGLSPTPLLLVTLEVMTKPSESAHRFAEPRLRVRSAHGVGDWPYIPQYKSVSPGSPLHRALEGEPVFETTTLTEICKQDLVDVEVAARVYPYGGERIRERVLALVRPADTKPDGVLR